MMFKLRYWIFIFLVGFLISDIVYFFCSPILPPKSKPIIYSLEPGTSFWKVAYQLHEQHLLSRPFYWNVAVMLQHQEKHFKVGDYQIEPGEKPLALLKQIISGKVVLYSLTIPEGWTFSQMLQLIVHHPYLRHGSLQALTVQKNGLPVSLSSVVMDKVGESGKHPEGRFFPSTYFFGRWVSDEVVFSKAHQTMREKLKKAWDGREVNLPYETEDDALIVASLIEKEAAKQDERPIIAGVICNRLNKKMYLQIDASVIYGLGERYQGKLTKEDLKIETPYNTYLHKGLPPTPICLPGFDSIYAALHPVKTNALFYVSRGDGTHQFSETFQQHHKAVLKYISKIN